MPASLEGRAEAEAFNTGTETGRMAFSCRLGAVSDFMLELRLSRLFSFSVFLLGASVDEADTGTEQGTRAEGCSFCFWFSCSAALCRAASTSSLRSLKSCGQSSGGVGGGVLNSTTVGLIVPRLGLLEDEPGIVVRLGGPFMLSFFIRPRVSTCMRVWTPLSRPVRPDPTKQPAPVKMAVAVLPSMLRSNVGAGRMTEGRVAGTSGGVECSGEAEPTDRLSDLLVRREIVN